MSSDKKRSEEIRAYLKRLSDGEALESVRADFVENFSDVEAMEIMEAEQDLIASGVPLEEVQKLCDVHSALFHGTTEREKRANAEKEVAASIERQKKKYGEELDKKEVAADLIAISGHPLNTLHLENEALEKLLKEKDEDNLSETIKAVLPVITHYAKKGDLIYPHLKVKYGVTGPSNVMWTVDDEIRDELKALSKANKADEKWRERAENVLKRIEEMIYKEENILFPASAMTFSEEDWKQIYRDFDDYKSSFGVEAQKWEDAEDEKEAVNAKDEIVLPGGSLNQRELQAMMKTMPIEITFIDENDINKYFNEGEKIFKRPSIALGHDVFSCHPPKIEKAARAIIDDFKNGKRDSVTVWTERENKPMMVTYMAVRDDDGKYVGTMELVQDMSEVEKHFSK